MKIVEKDPKSLDSSKGIIGAYYFSNVKLFRDLYNEISNLDGEKYISKLVDLGIRKELKVFATQAKFGFPLGTEADIIDFESEMSGKSIHQFKVNTYFTDIDGVLIKHDSGFHSQEEGYCDNQITISSNIEQLILQYNEGDRIVLTTSRPESQRNILLKLFSDIGFEFDDLIMGLGDGIRFLINDRKTTDSYIDTAVAINVSRDKPHTLINQLPKFMGVDIKNDLTSGSGAYTLKVSDPSKNSVIKKIVYLPDQNPEPTFVLNVQKKWYESISHILPNNIPKVHSFTRSEDFVCLEMEDITPSQSLNQIIYSTGQGNLDQTKIIVNNLSNCLHELYTQTSRPQKNYSSTELEHFIVNKAIPGVEALYKSAKYSGVNWHQLDKIEINGTKYNNPLKTLHLFLKQVQNSNLKNYGLISKIEAIIHGDLTGENILVKPNNNIYLIDPLSTYLSPQKRIKNELSMNHSTITYDFIKILQSFLAGYENWSLSTTSVALDNNKYLLLDESLAINSISTHMKTISDMYGSFGVNTSDENMYLLCSLMLFRLIPYRLLINEVSALYCLGLGTLMLERVL
jgi:tRNA A-37 threonylcarbamoyl transferase component Bud32